MTVVDHFRPGTPGSTPTVLPMGIFGTTTGGPMASRTTTSALPPNTNTGLIAGNDAEIDYYDRFFIRERLRACGGTLTLNVFGSLTLR